MLRVCLRPLHADLGQPDAVAAVPTRLVRPTPSASRVRELMRRGPASHFTEAKTEAERVYTHMGTVRGS